jgi:hypothetical protein
MGVLDDEDKMSRKRTKEGVVGKGQLMTAKNRKCNSLVKILFGKSLKYVFNNPAIAWGSQYSSPFNKFTSPSTSPKSSSVHPNPHQKKEKESSPLLNRSFKLLMTFELPLNL